MSDSLLEKAKTLIDDYCYDEFGHEADYTDLSNIPIAYTTYEDEETNNLHEIQVYVNLNDCSINMLIDDVVMESEKYDGLEGLIEYELKYLYFDTLISPSEDTLVEVRKNEYKDLELNNCISKKLSR